MKLSETKPYLESSGELEEQFFAIQDQGMIFDILRNKMYSNPILAICREISCNARDAHREVGNVEPVVIHLPNNLEPYYKIRDFGPGISPDRMTNIFIKYTASTKRSDNVQTGGFGLGAKTPFSYSDSFSIITVVDGVRYNYNCLIDETKVGKIMLANQAPTREKNGTEIIVPVMPKNFNDFRIYTEQACRHWTVKPIIKGGSVDWQNTKLILEGDKWGIAASGGYGNRNAQMIIDGIEYPLDLTALRNYADTKLIDAAHGNFVMHFGVGELSLSASRESIYLDEKTQAVIRGRLDQIKKSLKDQAMQKIEACANLWDANVFYNKELRKAFHNIDFLGTLTWKKIPLTQHHLAFGTKVYTFTKGKFSRKHGTDPNKLSRTHGEHLNFEEESALYFNDLTIKEPTPRHVKKAFDDNPKLKAVHVICPTDKVTKDYFDKKIHFDKMDPKFLSAITKATGRAYTPAAQRLLLFKFDDRASAFRQVSYSSVDEDTATVKVLCTLHRDSYNGTRTAILKGKSFLDWNSLRTLKTKFPNTSFYGVDDGTSQDRIKEDFSNFSDIQEFIKEKVFGNSSIDYTKIKYALNHHNDVEERIIRVIDRIKPLVKHKDSIFVKTIELQILIRSISKQDSGLLSMYESVHGEITKDKLDDFIKANPSLDIIKMNNLFEKQYPMVGHINSYNYTEIVGDIAHYVNLIDKEISNVK